MLHFVEHWLSVPSLTFPHTDALRSLHPLLCLYSMLFIHSLLAYSLLESLSLAISIFFSSLLVKLASLMSSFLPCCLPFLFACLSSSVQKIICLFLKKLLRCPSSTSALALRGCTFMKRLLQWIFGWLVHYVSTNFDLPLRFPLPFFFLLFSNSFEFSCYP